jgi:hypothetical protein
VAILEQLPASNPLRRIFAIGHQLGAGVNPAPTDV